jgi:DNA topoisomerase-6 subunit B
MRSAYPERWYPLSNKISFAEISPSEFFYRNRDLAGFTNPARALYMAVRELVENSLDAAEGAGTLPEVYVRIIPEGAADLPDPKPYRLTVIDNGPGVAPQHVPSAFGKVFYGSKYVLRQSRGMFGLGGTMAILYGQVTTNRPVVVTVSADGKRKHSYQMMIDIGENRPTVLKHTTTEANGTTGTRVDLTLEGDYTRALQKIGDYFKQTALVASYANLTFVDPNGQVTFYERATTSMPPTPKETLPHPYGIDVEAFKRLVKMSEEHDMKSFMVTHFHRVGEKIATKFLEFAGVSPRLPPKRLNNNQVVAIVDALQRFPDFLQPDAAVLSPVGSEILLAGMNKELQPEFSTVVERPPSSYSGFPFLVEVGLAYGGKILTPGVKLFRFANRIPLLYDESSDVSFEVLNQEVDWRRYHVPQDAPVGVLTHVASTRIPYKTVGKEYIADRPEIQREIRNAAREALRQLSIFLSKKGSMEAVQRKMNIYGKYLPLIAQFSQDLAGKKKPPDYSKLIGESAQHEAATEETVTEPAAAGQEGDVPTQSGQEIEQKTIDEYGGS